MKNLPRALFSLALMGVTIALVFSLRSLTRLRSANANLIQATNQLTRVIAEHEQRSNFVVEAQSADTDLQHRELLRLRSEVTSLRKQTNDLAQLQADNRRLREQRTAPAKESEPPPDPWRQSAIAKLSDSKFVVLGLLMNADANGGLISNNLDDLTNHLYGSKSTFTGTNEFELLYQGKLTALKNPSSIIVVRERNASLNPQGNWMKAYGFADGHAEYHNAGPTGDFAAWEEQHLPPATVDKP